MKLFFCISIANSLNAKHSFELIEAANKIDLMHKKNNIDSCILFVIPIPKYLIKKPTHESIKLLEYIHFQLSNGITLQKAITNFYNASVGLIPKYIAYSINNALKQGESFATATKEILDFTTTQLLTNLEKSGDLQEIISYLISYLKLKYELKNKLLSELKLPVLSFLFVIVLMFGLISYFTPVVYGLTKNKNSTNLLIIYQFILITIPTIACVAYFFYQKLLIKLPMIGNYILNFNFWIFSHNLHMTLKAKIPLKEGVYLSAFCMTNAELRNNILSAIKNMDYGISFYSMLSNLKNIPHKFLDTIMIGENNNKLCEVLKNFSVSKHKSLQEQIASIASISAILINLISGIVLVTILLSVIYPLYEFAESINIG